MRRFETSGARGPRAVALGFVLSAMVLSGCSVTGLDSASDRFHCNAPKGVPCSSTSGVYANSIAGTLPPTTATPEDEGATTDASPFGGARQAPPAHTLNTAPRRVVPGVGQAIRSLPKQLRVLVFPWVDADNDLHDQSYLYMAVDPGRWLIEHTRAGIRNDAPTPRLAGQQPEQPSVDASGRTAVGDQTRAQNDVRPPTLVIPRAGAAPTVIGNGNVPGLIEQPGVGGAPMRGRGAAPVRAELDEDD